MAGVDADADAAPVDAADVEVMISSSVMVEEEKGRRSLVEEVVLLLCFALPCQGAQCWNCERRASESENGKSFGMDGVSSETDGGLLAIRFMR
jgi:hypothetical protein